MVLIDLGGGAAAFCAAPLCPEYSPDPTATVGTVVASGCHSGGSLADSCALTCREGYQLTAPSTPGVCTLLVDSTTAEYIGQAATCEPERLPDGSLSAAYCFVEAPEVIATCCEGAAGPCDAASNLPSECTVLCAEAWLSLWQDCEDNLGQFSGLAATCEEAAENFMSAAPSTITVSGFRCHSYANGEYLMDDQTVGAKRAWTVRSGGQQAHLFFRDNPERWCFGDDVQSCFAEFQSYEDLPSWQQSTWLEQCNGASTDSTLLLDPGYSTHDCEQALQLVQEEVHSRCCTDESECIGGAPPSRCEYDCAHVWFPFSQDCADFLATAVAQDFSSFTAECDRTHATMLVLSQRGFVQAGSPWNATFPALQDVEYKVEMVPNAGLSLSALQVIAPHSHHVMASRFDSSTQSGGRKVPQWAATQDEAGVEISVTAIAGAGEFDLEVTIVGTIEHLAPEAITAPPSTSADVSVHTDCRWYDDCTFRCKYTRNDLLDLALNTEKAARSSIYAREHGLGIRDLQTSAFSCVFYRPVYVYMTNLLAITDNGQELRGSGSRFELRLHGIAGLSYAFSTELLTSAGMASSGTHISVGIYHESALGGSASSERIESADFALGQWTSRGSVSYAELHHCQASADDPDILTRVPCGGDGGDVGDFRTHPGESFPTAHSFEWPCAATGTYFVEVIANCDVPFCKYTSNPLVACDF